MAETFYLGSWAGWPADLARELGATEEVVKNAKGEDSTVFLVTLEAEQIFELSHKYDVMITTRSEHLSRKQLRQGVKAQTWRTLWIDTQGRRFSVR